MVAIPFVGPTYTSRSMTLDAQRCINFYVEEDEGGGGKAPAALYPTPGLIERYVLPLSPVRGMWTSRRNDRVFAVGREKLFELNADGTITERGTMEDIQATPVSMTDSTTELYITDGIKGYIFTYATNMFQRVTDPSYLGGGPATYQDGYFITVRPNSEQFFLSALNDGFTYNAADVSSADSKPDDLIAAFSDQRNLWLFGHDTTEIWYNSGNATFPFQRIQGAILDVGAINAACIDTFSGTLIWLGINTERGDLVVYTAQGPGTLRRISTHAIEVIMEGWTAPDESRSYTYEDQGHYFWVLWNPEGAVVYDFTTGMWHERLSLDDTGMLTAPRGATHTLGFGESLVGDFETGQIYALRLDALTENGRAIPRIRRAQYVDTSRRLVSHARLEIDFERGVGLDGAPPVGVNPQIQMRFSDTHGKTWSNYRQASMGKSGDYFARARYHKLGVSRVRLYEIKVTDPVFGAIMGAHLNG